MLNLFYDLIAYLPYLRLVIWYAEPICYCHMDLKAL